MRVNFSFLFAGMLFFMSFKLHAQCVLSGVVSDSLSSPVPYVPVALVHAKDSSIVKGVMADENGKFCFDYLNKGEYLVKVSSVGYEPYYSGQIDFDSVKKLEPLLIRLKASGLNLNEVSVSAQRKAVEFKNGNVIVNIEGTALAMGNTAYDLLSRLPGVTVSDGNISIQGKSGVRILIDGKLQQVSGTQLLNILKSMNASQIEKIEVLRKPPVKYDAAGTGGMINIKTKKIKTVGYSGSFFASYSQGFYGNPSGGFNISYKGKKINVFTGFTANKEWYHFDETFQNIYKKDSIETIVNSKNIDKQHSHSETYNIGLDWFINERNTVGMKMNGAFGLGNEDRNVNTDFSDNALGYQTLILNSNKPNPWIYPEFNLNAEHLFDTTGTVIRFSADYKPFWDIYYANFENRFQNNSGQDVQQVDYFKTSNHLIFHNSSALVDFEKEFKRNLKLETGLKHSYQLMLSDYDLRNYNYSSDTYTINQQYSNLFDYTQNISAGYLNLSKDFKKMSFQIGLRAENTMIQTNSPKNNLNFHRQYFNIFPVISIDYKKSDQHSFTLAYNKRVNRPDYNWFNPFQVFVTTVSSYKGNPYIKPEYSHDISFSHSYQSWLNNSVNFTRLYNPFIGYNTITDSSKSYVHTTGNLNYADVFAYSFFLQKDIYKWWSVNLNIDLFHIQANGILNSKKYVINTTAVMPNLYSRITLPKSYSVELSAFYLSPFLEGTYYVKSRSYLNLAVKKSFFNDNLSFSLAVNDIFYGQIRRVKVDYQNQYMTGYSTYDTRRLNISVNYNFGQLKIEQRQIKDIEPQTNKTGK